MSTAWYTDDIWKAYAGWLSPRWAEPRADFDAGEWADALARGGFRVAVIHAKHHDGLCFWPSRYRMNPAPRDFFGELVTALRAKNIRPVTYYSTTFDSETAYEHPEWCCRYPDGRVMELTRFPFPIGVCCHNHPGYRDFLLGQLAEIQERYDTGGFWMDGFDYTGYPVHACFCTFCRERYARERGGDLRAVPLDADGNPPADVKLWQRDVFRALMVDIRAVADKSGPDRIVVYNNAGACLELGYEEIDRLCDFHSEEAHSPVTKSLKGRLLSSQRVPWETYTPVADRVFSWTPRPTPALVLEAAIAAAHGGTLLAGLDLTPAGRMPAHQTEQMGHVGAWLRARTDLFMGAEPIHDVGLFLPKQYWKDERGGWAMSLLRNTIPFALLPLHARDFSPYRVVVLADSFPLDDGLVAALESYVAAGGNLIVEHDAAGPIAGADGDAFRLAHLVGVAPVGRTGFSTHYLGAINPALSRDIPPEPVRSDGAGWRIRPTTAETLARFVYPVATYSRERWIWREPNPPRGEISDDPALTINRVGKGRVAYVACAIGVDDARHRRYVSRLAMNLVGMLLLDPIVRSEAPSAVEVVVNRQPARNRHVVHLLNHAVDESGRWDAGGIVPALADVAVWIDERRTGPVRKISVRHDDGREMSLPVEREGTWVRLAIDRLRIHAAFVMDG